MQRRTSEAQIARRALRGKRAPSSQKPKDQRTAGTRSLVAGSVRKESPVVAISACARCPSAPRAAASSAASGPGETAQFAWDQQYGDVVADFWIDQSANTKLAAQGAAERGSGCRFMAGGFSCFDVWTGMTWSMDQLATRHQAADEEGCL